MRVTWNGIPIKTEFVYPPIPSRQMDWCATLGDYDLGVPYEFGPTEHQAIANLIQYLWERGQ